jgi:histidinol-phosphate aminotransferase
MLVDMNRLRRPHDEVCATLLSMGAIIRDGNALGCPGWARVSVGTQDEIEFFLSKLASLEVGAPGEGEGRTN